MATLLNYVPADFSLRGRLVDDDANVGKLLYLAGEDDGILLFAPVTDITVTPRLVPLFYLEGELYTGANAVEGDDIRVSYKKLVTGLSYSTEPTPGAYVYRGSGGILSLSPWASSTQRVGVVTSVNTTLDTYTCWFDGTFPWDVTRP